MEKGVIKNAVIIIVILGVAFISQQHYFDPFGKNATSWGNQQANSYWIKAGDWVKAALYPKAEEEIAKRGEPLKQEVGKQKDNAVKILWDKIKNYFAEKFSKISGTKVE